MELIAVEHDGVAFKVVLREAHQGFWRKYQRGEWEPENFRIFREFISPESTYIDVGAWEGPTLLFAAHLARRAVAFEPDPVAFQRLSENVQANPALAHVTLLNECVDAKEGTVSLGTKSGGGDSMSSMLLHDAATSWQVKAVRLDQFIADQGLPAPYFIKMDTEGAEYAIIPVLREFFRREKPTLYLSLHPPILRELFPNFLGKARAHLKLLWCLTDFPYLYDMQGHRVRLWDLLFRKRWRGFCSLVASYRPWKSGGSPAPEAQA